VVSKVIFLARGLPFTEALIPADTLELRGGAFSARHGNNAVLGVVDDGQRRGLLRGVVSQPLPLACCSGAS
jgi:hypothetical protein